LESRLFNVVEMLPDELIFREGAWHLA